ncbi:MAG: short-chain fatty acyl-CoA regulator family protein [Alphaproteobacteria bacterium]|nr:short-chain fatty acyl-CoA regulator family protein [Alphaproteobacteria bacterium]
MAREVERKAMLGHKVRRFRQEQGLSQTEMAAALEISASYLNLIEHNQRPVTVPLLFRLGQSFEIDLKAFAQDDEAALAAGLREVLSDPLFQGQPVREQEVRELAAAAPVSAESILTLYKAYRELREEAEALAERMSDPERGAWAETRTSAIEDVRDFLEAERNHFPELETAAEELWRAHELAADDLFRGLSAYLEETLGTGTRVMPVEVMQDTLRRYDLHRRRVLLSEALPPSGRAFQLAVQIALLGYADLLDRITVKAGFKSPEAARLCRASLANYFAGAVMMPYDRFIAAVRELVYDIELLQHRFAASFEQVCHRLTTLQRPGARGVPFFFIRLDNAGNVSKRLSGAGFHFARFGGTCPRWIVHDAFRWPERILTQVARMPDGQSFFTIARTLPGLPGWQASPQPQYALALGCEIRHASELVYAQSLDLKGPENVMEIGVSCRVCERLDCHQRAVPPLNQPLSLDENVRRLSPFSPPPF